MQFDAVDHKLEFEVLSWSIIENFLFFYLLPQDWQDVGDRILIFYYWSVLQQVFGLGQDRLKQSAHVGFVFRDAWDIVDLNFWLLRTLGEQVAVDDLATLFTAHFIIVTQVLAHVEFLGLIS